MTSTQVAYNVNGSAPPNKKGSYSSRFIRNIFKWQAPEPQIKIQNMLTDLLLIVLSIKITQVSPLHHTKGHQSSRWEMSLNDISLTSGSNSK